jgi:hypothetical protein
MLWKSVELTDELTTERKEGKKKRKIEKRKQRRKEKDAETDKWRQLSDTSQHVHPTKNPAVLRHAWFSSFVYTPHISVGEVAVPARRTLIGTFLERKDEVASVSK